MSDVSEKVLEEYITSSGKNPFADWLDSLQDRRAQALVLARLDRLRAGLLGSTRTVGGGVHELKIDYGSGYRVYFGNDGVTLVILLIGGSKKTQISDIAIAKSYWKDYQMRKSIKGRDYGKK